MTGPGGPLHVAVLQTAPVLYDITRNVESIAGGLGGADLGVTPELSLTGYDVRDAVHDLALPISVGAPLPAPLGSLGSGPALVLGLVECGDDAIPYNTAIVVADGVVRHRHRKVYLPTYGMFDEGRWFGRGGVVELTTVNGWRVAVLVCEDLWHPALVYIAAMAGADLLVVPAAAPGRGVVEGGPEGGLFASAVAWYELVRVSARAHGMYVVLANRTGVEDGITFAGGSLIAAPDGSILAAAGDGGPERIDAVLEPAELARARRPFAHRRDEDPRILARALASIGALP